MDNDVFEEDDSQNNELELANRELKQKLNSIETAAFHDGFEDSREKNLQKAFDTGYELIYKHFQAISTLEGIYDSAYYAFKQLHTKEHFDDIKQQFVSIYSDLFANFNQQIERDVESKICMDRNYTPIHIVPSADLIERFNRAKRKVIEICSIMNLNDLCLVTENVNL